MKPDPSIEATSIAGFAFIAGAGRVCARLGERQGVLVEVKQPRIQRRVRSIAFDVQPFAREAPNPSIEGTATSGLRPHAAATHAERYASETCRATH
jgi:hypothetical protein